MRDKSVHEPCTSRGECYHSRAGRIGARNQPREVKIRNGRIGARRMREIWGNTPEAHEARVRGGFLGGQKTQKGWGKTSEAQEVRFYNGHKMQKKWGKTPEAHEARVRGGRKAVESGQLAEARKKSIAVRPTWPECVFYGLVLGNSVTRDGFTAQQSDGHGIYDGAWLQKKIIVELDGGGHHAFRDRHAEDTLKDNVRLLSGSIILREEDENVLFLKALAILKTTQ